MAAIQAQIITPAITSQNQNIYRSLGNLGQVSTYSKTIDTPYSSVSKSDVRVSNPGIQTIGGLGYSHGLAPIGVAHGLSPYGVAHGLSPYGVAHGVSPYGVAHGLSPYGVAHAPLTVSHGISPLGVAHGSLVAPRLALPAVGVARPVGVAPAGLLGVAYSAAPVVSHMSYSNGLGLSYAW